MHFKVSEYRVVTILLVHNYRPYSILFQNFAGYFGPDRLSALVGLRPVLLPYF